MTTPDSGRDTSSFEIADQKIGNLLKQLNDKNVCPCCVARALAFHAASLAMHSAGSAEAIQMFGDIVSSRRKYDIPIIPAPAPLPSREAH
jgi:hypothetical protein